MRHRHWPAFTLVELLVVIAIIGVMVALLLPGVQAAREAARRAQCSQRIAQLMIAVQNYESAHEVLPPGVTNPTGPIRNEPIGLHHGWMLRLLPYIDETAVYRAVDFNESVYSPANAAPREMSLPFFICPSATGYQQTASSYAGCQHDVEAPIDADNNGLLFLNSQIHLRDIRDGASHTIFLGEKRVDPDDLGWMSGTRATLRNVGSPLNEPALVWPTVGAADGQSSPGGPAAPIGESTRPITYVGGFGSEHPGAIALFGFADGSLHTLTDEISARLLRQLANRADGELLESREY